MFTCASCSPFFDTCWTDLKQGLIWSESSFSAKVINQKSEVRLKRMFLDSKLANPVSRLHSRHLVLKSTNVHLVFGTAGQMVAISRPRLYDGPDALSCQVNQALSIKSLIYGASIVIYKQNLVNTSEQALLMS